jgi:hypothetical protein
MEGGLFDKLSLRSHSKSSSKSATKELKDKKDKKEKVVSPPSAPHTITEKLLTSGILSKIFGFLAPKDLLSVALTCKRWHESFQIISAPLRRKNHGVLFYTKPEVEALLSGGEASSAQENIERTASKSTLVTNHSFHDKTLTSPTFCIICTKFIWVTIIRAGERGRE